MEAIRDVTDDEFRQLWATAKSIRDVQKACGLTYDATYQKARGLGLPRRASKGKTKQIDVPLLYKLWGREVEVREIAHVLGVSEAYVGRLARKHHLPKRLPQKAENNGRTVADPTPEEIAERAAEIRARRPVAQDDGTVEIRCYAFDARHAVYSEGSLWVA